MEEIWKDISNFEGLYQISNYGNVRSVTRTIKTPKCDQTWQGVKIKSFDNGRGYQVVHLRKDGKRYVKYVHRLVVESFIGFIGKNDINHKDFNRANNNLNNLEIVTRKENIIYSKKAGKYENFYKTKYLRCKEKYDLIKENIIQDYNNGMPISKIEKKYQVNHKTLKKYNYI